MLATDQGGHSVDRDRQYREAATVHESLVQTSPNDGTLLNNLAWLYGELGDPRALGHAEKAYALMPSDPGAMDTLGWILV